MAEIGSVTVAVSVEPTEEFDAVARVLGYVKERACFLVKDDENRTACSKCGASYLCMSEASYCPDCGAKVVRE